MSGIRLAWHEFAPSDCTGGAITIGNFDGVHRGHRSLIEAAKRRAEMVNGPAVVVTFDPPPLAILNPSVMKPPLSTVEDRTAVLLAAGADRVITFSVDAALLALSPEAFFEDVIVRQLQAKALIEGSDFRFGRRREGDVLLLKRLCDESRLHCDIIRPVEWNGEAVSSSRVRSCLTAGDVSTVCHLLARPYSITGMVVSGAKRGRTIGFPTANLDRVPTLVPGIGVYAVRAIVDGQAWPAAANVGPNPTFGEDERKIEVHLIDYTGDLYGRSMRVEFVERIRDTKPFAGVEELKNQLAHDIEKARQILAD